MWEGEGWFLSGANLPWFNWNEDFSGNPGGVAANRSAIQARIASHDPHNVRWWAFPGNAWQLTPANIAATFTDFDAALAMAEELDLYYTFVVYSDATSLPVSQSARSTQLAALEILFERYGDNPRILAWEVVNEPEWAIWSGMVNEEATRTYVEAVITLIKDETDAYATVGSAMLDGLALWPSVDFYQPHWYDSMDSGGWCAWCKSADEVRAEFGLADKPIVIGEFYTGADVGGASRYAHWYDAGYAGAWAWSLFPERTQDGMQVTGMSSFDQGHADDGPAGGGSPAPTATATPGATGTLTGIVRGEGRSNHAGIRVQVSPGNLSATTDSIGRFTIVGIRAGNTYTVTATLNGYLVAQQVGVAGTNGVRTLTTGVLRGGDVNMDGIVSIVDLAATSADFDGPPQAGSTDVNGTGIVDIADLAIVSQNFDLQGPTGW